MILKISTSTVVCDLPPVYHMLPWQWQASLLAVLGTHKKWRLFNLQVRCQTLCCHSWMVSSVVQDQSPQPINPHSCLSAWILQSQEYYSWGVAEAMERSMENCVPSAYKWQDLAFCIYRATSFWPGKLFNPDVNTQLPTSFLFLIPLHRLLCFNNPTAVRAIKGGGGWTLTLWRSNYQ